jgi:hypothetical protein
MSPQKSVPYNSEEEVSESRLCVQNFATRQLPSFFLGEVYLSNLSFRRRVILFITYIQQYIYVYVLEETTEVILKYFLHILLII